MMTTAISGCSASRVDLVDSGVLTIQQRQTGKVYVAWSDAYEDDGGFTITGVLRRRDVLGGPIKAHADITLLSPEGQVISEARSKDVYVSRRIVGRGRSFQRFKVRFPNAPVKGSKITVVADSGAHNSDT